MNTDKRWNSFCTVACALLATTALRGQAAPMPVRRAADASAGALLTYDMATGKERIAVSTPRESWLQAKRVAGSSGPGRVGVETHLGPQTFGRRENVTASQSPWTRNIKLFIDFNGKSIQGTGIMIDAKHVLTAGRCVYDRHAGGWAKRIVLAPGYNGQASGKTRAPFGYLRPKSLQTFDAWKTTGHFEHDVGLIELEHPVGALTGWSGYGYDYDCNFFTKSTFYRASYPAAGPYDGTRLYFHTGNFDLCRTVRVAQYNNKSYDGEAGSGFYAFLGNSRYVFAIHSGYSPHGFSLATRLDRDKFGKIQTWIRRSRSTTPDLTPLTFTGPTIVGRGQPIRSASFLVHNDSAGTFDGPIYFTVRLSRDRRIHTVDKVLGRFALRRKIQPLQTVRIASHDLSRMTIPVTTAPGRYYVGVILDPYDWNPDNQHTRENDVLEITVTDAGFFPLGTGCTGSNGRLKHTATSSLGRPVIGRPSRFSLSHGPANSVAGFTLGASSRRWGSIPLPLDLSALGAPGCRLYVAPRIRLWMPTDPRGNASISLLHRNSRSLVGLEFFTQFVAIDRRANALGFTYSNGMRSKIGDA